MPKNHLKPLSGRGSTISYSENPNGFEVLWGRLKFTIPSTMVEDILHKYFAEQDRWYQLGASMDNPIKGGLGEFIQDNYWGFTPRHASAIAAILVNENLLSFRGKKPIELKLIK
jgi:hypothetical protein